MRVATCPVISMRVSPTTKETNRYLHIKWGAKGNFRASPGWATKTNVGRGPRGFCKLCIQVLAVSIIARTFRVNGDIIATESSVTHFTSSGTGWLLGFSKPTSRRVAYFQNCDFKICSEMNMGDRALRNVFHIIREGNEKKLEKHLRPKPVQGSRRP